MGHQDGQRLDLGDVKNLRGNQVIRPGGGEETSHSCSWRLRALLDAASVVQINMTSSVVIEKSISYENKKKHCIHYLRKENKLLVMISPECDQHYTMFKSIKYSPIKRFIPTTRLKPRLNS